MDDGWYIFWVFDVDKCVKSVAGRIIYPNPMAAIDGPYPREELDKKIETYKYDFRIKRMDIIKVSDRETVLGEEFRLSPEDAEMVEKDEQESVVEGVFNIEFDENDLS